MPVGGHGIIKKHLIAVGIGLLAFVAYCVLFFQTSAPVRPEDGLMAAGVLLGTLTSFSCLFLAIEVCIHKPADLGKLRDERSALLAGLCFTFAVGVVAIGKVFVDLPNAPPPKHDRLWIHNSWGPNGKCRKSLKIGPGANELQLAIETGGEHHVRQLLAPPTDNEVKTEGGIFELREDGSMASTVQGYKGIRFTRCRR